MHVVLRIVTFGSLQQNILHHFLAEPHFSYDSCRNTCLTV